MQIEIEVAGKVATAPPEAEIVCGNKDYEIAFAFDSPWNEYKLKTARFVYQRQGKTLYEEKVFEGNICPVPIMYDVLEVRIGVYAGNLSTSTPAIVNCKRSILCGDPVHAEPPEDIYNQIVGLVAEANNSAEVAQGAAEQAAASAKNTEEIVGNIEVAIDEILALQASLIGGASE